MTVTTPSDLAGFGVLRHRDLSVLAFAQGFTLWHYKALHLPTWRIMVPGFFDPAGERDAQRMRHGDMILISANDGGACAFVGPGSLGARFTLQPINLPYQMESHSECLSTHTLPPPAQSRLRQILRRLVNGACWSR